jgi:hypothetical protein
MHANHTQPNHSRTNHSQKIMVNQTDKTKPPERWRLRRLNIHASIMLLCGNAAAENIVAQAAR